jgi:hypothetical protein
MSKNGDFQICPQTYLKDLKTSAPPVRDAWQKKGDFGTHPFQGGKFTKSIVARRS